MKMNGYIEESIRRQKSKLDAEVKLLLLGAGESGKSTVLKQMKIIHESGFSTEQRLSFKSAIYINVLGSLKTLVQVSRNRESEYVSEDAKTAEDIVLSTAIHNAPDLTPQCIRAIKVLLDEPCIRQALEKPEGYYIIESTQYTILSPEYEPTTEDILRCRIKTTGITEFQFKIGKLNYRMFDVGGQRSERMKWRYCFGNATAMIFMVALSEYDQVLLEDPTANRMQESMTLFSSLINNKPFTDTPIILFLNKIDIFEKKISRSPIESHFPDYAGGPFVQPGVDYFKQLFLSLDQSGRNRIYVKETCATNTDNIKYVMNAVNDIFIQQNLRAAGLL